jgi:hypothetical protein
MICVCAVETRTNIRHRWNNSTSVRSSARGVGNSPSYVVFTLAVNIELINRPVLRVEEPKVDYIGSIVLTLRNVVLVLSYGICGMIERTW